MSELMDVPPPPEMELEDVPPPPEEGRYLASLKDVPAPPEDLQDVPPPPDMGREDKISQITDIANPPKGEMAVRPELLQRMYGTTNVTPEQLQRAQATVKGYKEKETSARQMWQDTKDTAKLGIVPFQLAQRLIIGNSVRALRPDLYDSLQRSVKLEGENPDKREVFTKIDQALNTVAPDIYASQLFVDKQAELMENLGFNKTVARGAAASTGLVVDILTDPLTYVTFGASTGAHIKKLKAGEEAFQTALKQAASKSESEALIVLDKLKKTIPSAKPYADQIADGERAMVSFKVPFRSPETSKVLIKGETAARLWTNAMQHDAVIKAKRALPFLQMETGNLRVDDAFAKHTMWKAATKMRVNEIMSQFPEMTDNVRDIVNAIDQYGPKKAKGFLDKVAKIKYTDDEFNAANQLLDDLSGVVDQAAEFNGVGKTVEGKNVFKAANYEERLDLVKELQETIPGFKKEWLPYAFREQYKLPRKLSNDAKLAGKTRLDRSSSWENVIGGGKYKMTADAEKESSKFSTMVQDLLKGKETGLSRSFESDPVKRVAQAVEDMFNTAGNKQFAEEILEHGWTSKQVELFKELRRDLKVIPPELQGLIGVDINSLKKVEGRPWEKLKLFVSPADEVKQARREVKMAGEFGEEIGPEVVDTLADAKNYKARVIKEDFLTTPEIALGIENRFGMSEANRGVAAALGIKWYNDQWRRTVLTNPLRLPRESVENMAAYGMARGNPKYLMDAVADTWKFSSDPAKNKADTFTTLFFNSPYSEHLGNFDADLLKAPMTMEQVVSRQANNVDFMQTLHDAARSGQKEALADLVGLTEKEIKSGKLSKLNPLQLVEKITDSTWARNTRNFVGGAASNTAKLALAKTYHFDHGLPIHEAFKKADQAMVSFIDINSSVKTARNYSPFISYNLRNIQRLPILFAASPAGVDFYNKVRQASSNYNGWTPEDNVVFENLIGGATAADPIIGPMLRGTDAMTKDADFLSDYISSISREVVGEEKYNKMMQQKQFVSWYLPDPYRSSINFTNPEKAIENVSPILKAGIAMLGKDPFTGKNFAYEGTELQTRERIKEMIDELNPLQYHAVVRGAQVIMRAGAEQYKEHLLNQGKDPKVVDSEYKSIYGDNWIKQKEKDRKAIAATVSWATLGLGTMTNLDFQFMIKQNSLIKESKTLQSDLMKKKYKGDATKAEIETVKKALVGVREQVHFNSDLMQSFRKALSEGKPFLNKVEKELDKAPQRKPNSVGPMSKIMNAIFPSAQAMGGPAPREIETMDRASAATRRNLKPIPNRDIAEENVDVFSEPPAGNPQEMAQQLKDKGYSPEEIEKALIFERYRERTDDTPGSDQEIEDAIKDQLEFEENQ